MSFYPENGQKGGSVLTVEDWPIEQVIPYERNPRKNAGAVAKVAASLREFGWRQPLVVDRERVLIVGHTRLLAAKDLGMTRVPVHIAEDLEPAKARAYRLADNRSGEEAEWDADLLGLEFKGIELDGLSLELTGFDRMEWSRSLGRVGEKLDAMSEWQGMPEFVQEDKTAFKSLTLHFPDQAAVDAFSKLTGQTITANTKFAWFPRKRERERLIDQQYEPAA